VVDVLILGGGPSGLTAAIYTARAGLSTVVLAGNPPGGQLMLTSEVENFPGFPDGIKGPELILHMRKQAERFNVALYDENAVKVLGSFKENFVTSSDSGKNYASRTVIIATGASAKWLGLESEQKLRGRGVSACATCDGFFFKGKIVAVAGGGDAAMEEALFLTKFVEKVYLLARGSKNDMKASKIMLDRVLENPKIELRYNSEVQEVLGEESVEGLKIKNNSTNITSTLTDVKGLFVAIGHKPNTEFLLSENAPAVELGKFGYAVPKECTHTHTNQEGVFIAGDVSDHKYRQAITAAGFGCMAALDCQKFLSQNNPAL
jgi:thioredoxin reductase (NADPH)